MTYNLPIVYGEGLERGYGVYHSNALRARTQDDILIASDEMMHIDINDARYKVAIGAWKQSDDSNVYYGNWNGDISGFYQALDVKVKLVFARSDNADFVDGEIPSDAFVVSIYKIVKQAEYHT